MDGGVADNQGLDALVRLDGFLGDGRGTVTATGDFDVLLVSDASGQMDVKHRVGRRAFAVMARTMSIFQFQLRRKVLKSLLLWKAQDESNREFAFVHLLLNLKDRQCTARVPTEYIPALGGIRTDLDQFSVMERDALMYHGYTLIDAQIRRHCGKLISDVGDGKALSKPPLFDESQETGGALKNCIGDTRRRRRVKEVLAAGSRRMFLCRSWQRHPWKSTLLVFVPGALWLAAGVAAVGHWLEALHGGITAAVQEWLCCAAPDWRRSVLEKMAECDCFVVDTRALTFLIAMALWLYVELFLIFSALRRLVKRWDLREYEALTGRVPTVDWNGSVPTGDGDRGDVG